MQFKGIYSDLAIPVETSATITLQQDRMLIEIPSGNESREWFYGMIRRKKLKGHELTLTCKDPMKGRLIIGDPQFLIEARRTVPYAQFVNPVPWYKSKNGLYLLFAVKFGTIAAAILLFFFAVPLLINFAVDRINPQTERSIGLQIRNMIVSPTEVDTLQTRLVNDFFSHFTNPGDDSIYITVIDSRVKNAFTLPGGEILIDTAIFSVMEGYPELAAVLGHESGHAVNRHSLKMLCRESATSILLLVMVGNINGVINQILNNASYIGNLSYSREYEKEADHFDYEWMKKNNVNPQGIIDLLTHLEKEHGSGMNVEFISTHPNIQNRIDDIQELMKHDDSRHYENNEQLDSIWKQIKGSSEPKHLN